MRSLLFRGIRLVTADYWPQRKRRRTLFVLMFHQVSNRQSRYYPSVPVAAFAEICAFLKRYLPVLTFSEVSSHFAKTDDPAAVITFDDGHIDFKEHAWPILRSYGLSANVNIDTEILHTGLPQDNVRIYDVLNATRATRYVNRDFFPDPIGLTAVDPYMIERQFSAAMTGLPRERRRRLSDDVRSQLADSDVSHSRVLSADDVRLLSREGVEIGSHTHTHTVLSNLDDGEVERELTESRQILSGLCGRPIDVLAYPNGIADARVETIARRVGYKHLLKTGDAPTLLQNPLGDTYDRLNIYQRTAEEGLAQAFGVYGIVRGLRNTIRGR